MHDDSPGMRAARQRIIDRCDERRQDQEVPFEIGGKVALNTLIGTDALIGQTGAAIMMSQEYRGREGN